MKSIIEVISEKIKSAFTECGYEERFGIVNISNRPDLCQYQCNGAMAAAKQYKKAPAVIAGEVCEKLAGDDFFSQSEAVNPGFINLSVSDYSLAEFVQQIAVSDKFGYEPQNTGRTAMVDYGGANVAKPLHIGHLRSAVIGESVKRLLKYDGYNTIGDAHLGDWGLQMGLIINEMKKRQPDLCYFDESYEGEYPKEAPFTISELEEIYPFASGYAKEHEDYKEEARQATYELQQGRRGYYALWQHIVNVSVADLKKNYDNLNVHFELWKKESDANEYIPAMIEDMKNKGIARLDEGALVVDVAAESDTKEMPPCILLKSDGAALYASTDLATLVERELLYKPDRIVYVTDKRQSLHFEQVFRVSRKAGIVRDEVVLDHLGFGTMNGKDGKPFKTRDGGVLRLEFLIDDIAEAVFKKMEDRDMTVEEAREISKIVGLAALKYGDLSNQASKDYVFDVERFASFEGNTGPYILYTMVRIKSILEKYAKENAREVAELRNEIRSGSFALYHGNKEAERYGESERKLMLSIAAFHDAVSRAALELAPHKLCSYIYELANAFNSFYHENRIIAQENKTVQEEWIALIVTALGVLEESIELLAVNAPDKM